MLQFIQQYYLFIITVGSTLIILITAYLIYNYRYHKNTPVMVNDLDTLAETKKISDVQSYDDSKTISDELDLHHENPSPEPIIEEKIESIVPKTSINSHPISEPNPQEMKMEEVENDQEFDRNDLAMEEEEQEEEQEVDIKPMKKTLGKYHIVFRQSNQMWVVKREGSDKIIRALYTQKEAIAYATIKALSQDTTFVIHKKDGKIRKQNYSKTTK